MRGRSSRADGDELTLTVLSLIAPGMGPRLMKLDNLELERQHRGRAGSAGEGGGEQGHLSDLDTEEIFGSRRTLSDPS